MTESTMEEYMTRTREGYGLGIGRLKIEEKDHFELKGHFLKKLRDNTLSGSDNEDANEEKVYDIIDLFYIPNITQDQVMLRAFPMSLTRAASRWLRNEPAGSIKTWKTFKENFLNSDSQGAISIYDRSLMQRHPVPLPRDGNHFQKWHNDMDQDSAHMVAASKVPMLKPGKFEIWRMRIEQYIRLIDYALWGVIADMVPTCENNNCGRSYDRDAYYYC
ncbi:hypothetical protein Tco_1246330 [Tanacetum coccineum]